MVDRLDANGQIIGHTYTYFLTDLRNNEIVAEVPMSGVSYSSVLSGIGEASGSIPINEVTKTFNLLRYAQPAKVGLYIMRDNVLVWGGIVWKREYNTSTRTVRLIARGFESYYYRRFNHKTMYWANEDQLDIARWIVNDNGASDDLLIDVSDKLSVDRRRERVMFGYEFKTLGEELERLGALIDGFDWNVVVYRDASGSFRRLLDFWYPQAGRPLEQSNLVFEFPGSIKEFSMTENAEESANVMWAIGIGEGTEQVVEYAEDAAQLADDWPLLELSRSYKSVSVPSTLAGHAQADLDRLRTPVTVFEVTIDPDIEPQLGTYALGDWARFVINDDFYSPPFDGTARITGINVSVDEGTGRESVKLTLGGKEVGEYDEPLQ